MPGSINENNPQNKQKATFWHQEMVCNNHTKQQYHLIHILSIIIITISIMVSSRCHIIFFQYWRRAFCWTRWISSKVWNGCWCIWYIFISFIIYQIQNKLTYQSVKHIYIYIYIRMDSTCFDTDLWIFCCANIHLIKCTHHTRFIFIFTTHFNSFIIPNIYK